MIAKGLDFPNVTFVGGVLNADTALGLPDFRSAEKKRFSYSLKSVDEQDGGEK